MNLIFKLTKIGWTLYFSKWTDKTKLAPTPDHPQPHNVLQFDDTTKEQKKAQGARDLLPTGIHSPKWSWDIALELWLTFNV